MKAMIFAAGLGTRLAPLTHDRPKALVEVCGRSLLETNIRKLEAAGFTDIVVNVHHFAGKVIQHLEERNWKARIHISDERHQLLETGGGLLHARTLLDGDEPFLVHNVDILTDLDLAALWQFHQQAECLSTLAIRQRQTSRHLLFDEGHLLHGWLDVRAGIVRQKRPTESDLHFWAFSGVHVISPRIFGLFRRGGKFSIIDSYLDLAKTERIMGFPHKGLWLDVGKPERLEEAQGLFA